MKVRTIDSDTKLEGLSLSFCVFAILAGIVKEAQVERIITSTNAPNALEFEKVLDSYAESYWSDAPEEGKGIARRFYEAGMIDQPRTRGGTPTQINDGCWRIPGETEQFNIRGLDPL